MEPFEAIVKHCQANSQFTKPLIDDFLIYYAAQTDRLERKIAQKLKPYKHIALQLPTEYVNMLKSEYIASQIFRKNGLLGKYLRHSAIKALTPTDYNFLKFQHEHPWRFSFAQVLDQPAKHFFRMIDAFTGEEYLLYSPGMSRTLADEPIHLWFNLIAFNGNCWQSYGLIIGFNSFTANDLFFFATELNPDIEDDEDLIREVEKNPWPFFMLLISSRLPFTQSRGALLVFHTALDEVSSFPQAQLKEAFTIRKKDGVYELRLETWSEPPHFATAYFDEREKTLFRFASTEAGFSSLSKILREQGLPLDPEPEVEVTPSMLITTEKVLRRKIEINPYEKRFIERNEEHSEELDKLNHFLNLAMPFLNSNEPFDIEKLAAEAGVEIETAKEVMEKVQEQLRKLGKDE